MSTSSPERKTTDAAANAAALRLYKVRRQRVRVARVVAAAARRQSQAA